MCVCLLQTCVCPSPSSSLASATSSVEELPGIFSRERKVPRNTAQQLYDVGYVVYRGEREGERDGGKRRKEGMPIERRGERRENRDRQCRFNGKRGIDKEVACKEG